MSIASRLTRQLAIHTFAAAALFAQSNPGDWKTWIIPSAKDHGVAPSPGPAETHAELEWLRQTVAERDSRIAE